MVQLPSAARLSGNSSPASVGGLLHGLQHAAGLDGQGQVGARRCSRTRFRRARLSSTCVPLASGTPPPTSPVLPPCGTMAAPAAAQARTHGRHLVGRARPHHRQRLAAPALAPVELVGREVAVGQHLRRADDVAQQGDQRRVHGATLRAARSGTSAVERRCALMRLPHRRSRRRTCRTQAANSSRHSAISAAASAAEAPPLAGRAHHALGEVEPHQQADPAVGVQPELQQAGQRAASGSTFSASVRLPVGASQSSQARPSAIRASRLATASARVTR